ncbi:cytosine-specific methyltransferase, putative, partial [Medicago truncatula]
FVLCILSSKFYAIGFAIGFRRRLHFNSPTQLSQGTHVAYSTYENYQLANALNLEDAINDLPLVENDDSDDERSYGTTPRTYFQKYIRLKRSGMSGQDNDKGKVHVVEDDDNIAPI